MCVVVNNNNKKTNFTQRSHSLSHREQRREVSTTWLLNIIIHDRIIIVGMG